MAAKYIWPCSPWRFWRRRSCACRAAAEISHPQTKTWLLIGVIFAAVSAWLFSRGNRWETVMRQPEWTSTPRTDRRWDVGAYRVAEPGPIGLDSKSGDAKQSAPSMADRIVGYARRNRGDARRRRRVLHAGQPRAARRERQERQRTTARSRLTRIHLGDIGHAGRAAAGRRDSVPRLHVQAGGRHRRRQWHDDRRARGRPPAPHRHRPERGRQRRGHGLGAERPGRLSGHAHAAVLHLRKDHERQRTTTITVRGTFWFYRPEAR